MLLLLACTETPSTYLAYVREGTEYTVAPRSIESLKDPHSLSGDLGTIYYGGRLSPWNLEYQTGRRLEMPFVVEEGTAIPLDPDGVLLYSFYGGLEDIRDWVDSTLGSQLDSIFPLPIAWNASAGLILELLPADNAGYATGSNFFLLLPDGANRPVPLIANAGVVAHEYGHAVFHLLLTGNANHQPLATDPSTLSGHWQAALHEGFADMQAVLFTDDPAFISHSLDLPERDVREDWSLTADLFPENSEEILLYDPYPVGTVFAAMAWDLREELDDREQVYRLFVRAVQEWAPDEAALSGESFLDALVAVATEEETAALCTSIQARFADYHIPADCR